MAAGSGDASRLTGPSRDWLRSYLSDAQGRGFVGPGDVDDHIGHAEAMAAFIGAPGDRALDLGTGAGVPGLVLALMFPATRWCLLDGSTTRSRFLRQRTASLPGRLPGLRLEVVSGRAEELARSPLRASFDLVVARSFGAPAVAAECGAPFLVAGGRLAVSEPPGETGLGRWPAGALAQLGMEPSGRSEGPPAFQMLTQVGACPDRFPRRVGVPAKRPLF